MIPLAPWVALPTFVTNAARVASAFIIQTFLAEAFTCISHSFAQDAERTGSAIGASKSQSLLNS